MTSSRSVFVASVALASLLIAPVAVAQTEAPSPQAAAIRKLDFMRGVWVGPASGMNPDGSRFSVTQTERIGSLLGGDIIVIEGRGYETDGSTSFNAFAVLSWNTAESKYEMRSFAEGYAGTFPFVLTDNGYAWEVPAGPGVMRFTADVSPTTYHEVGDFVMPGRPPMRSFEMTLTRRGDTDWPAAGAIDPAQ